MTGQVEAHKHTNRLIDETSSAWVQAYLDIGNVLKFGFPQDWVDTLGSRIARVDREPLQLAQHVLGGVAGPAVRHVVPANAKNTVPPSTQLY